jgi:hypothetical protein
LRQDLPAESPRSSIKWHEILQNGLESGGEVANWAKYIHQLFSAPPTFDIDALMSQAKARVDALDAHLWLLQTEPAYFRKHLRMLEQTTIIANFQGKLISKELLAIEVMSELQVHWCWRDLLEAFEQARDVHHRFRDSIHPGTPLLKNMNNQLGALELQVVNILRFIQIGTGASAKAGV